MSSEAADVNLENEKPVKKASAKKVVKSKKGKTEKAKQSKRGTIKFTINCTVPVKDEIFDMASFEKFLHDRIKVNGKAGVLGDAVSIATEATNVNVTAKNAFSKRYLKYLTKKFLKKQNLRDYVRVIAGNRNGYDLRYFNIHNEEEEEAQ